VLINGAGGVGTIGIQIARTLGGRRSQRRRPLIQVPRGPR
jgi:NADPH:quinone reductase-like Zn-dependent oxidoreductase